MTRKIFWEDPYLDHLETKIKNVQGNEVMVNETIFYALNGGQESDTGTIGGFRVLQAQKQDKAIVYTMEANHTLHVGDQVEMLIDWERRYRLMRLHFAAEIVLELVYKHLHPIVKIGAHIAEEKARIDFELNENISSYFPLIKKEAMELIEGDKDIVSAFDDEHNERRYWEIAGFSKVPCGGTHIKKTGEIGAIDLKRKNIGKGKERIEIYLIESA